METVVIWGVGSYSSIIRYELLSLIFGNFLQCVASILFACLSFTVCLSLFSGGSLLFGDFIQLQKLVVYSHWKPMVKTRPCTERVKPLWMCFGQAKIRYKKLPIWDANPPKKAINTCNHQKLLNLFSTGTRFYIYAAYYLLILYSS